LLVLDWMLADVVVAHLLCFDVGGLNDGQHWNAIPLDCAQLLLHCDEAI
jgi:hypothetical protein